MGQLLGKKKLEFQLQTPIYAGKSERLYYHPRTLPFKRNESFQKFLESRSATSAKLQSPKEPNQIVLETSNVWEFRRCTSGRTPSIFLGNFLIFLLIVV